MEPPAQRPRTARTEEKNRGRHEIRELVTQPIEPVELGLLGAAQVARLDRHRTEQGQTKNTQLWLATSRACEELPPAAFLAARRAEWGIENGLHHVLDVSGDEDRRLKVRTLNSLCVLTLLSRVSVALWKRTQRGRKRPTSYYRWRKRQEKRCGWLLKLLRSPPVPQSGIKWSGRRKLAAIGLAVCRHALERQGVGARCARQAEDSGARLRWAVVRVI